MIRRMADTDMHGVGSDECKINKDAKTAVVRPTAERKWNTSLNIYSFDQTATLQRANISRKK